MPVCNCNVMCVWSAPYDVCLFVFVKSSYLVIVFVIVSSVLGKYFIENMKKKNFK